MNTNTIDALRNNEELSEIATVMRNSCNFAFWSVAVLHNYAN